VVNPAAVPAGAGQQWWQRRRQFSLQFWADGQIQFAHAVEVEQGPGGVGLARPTSGGPAGQFLEHAVKVAERLIESFGGRGLRYG